MYRLTRKYIGEDRKLSEKLASEILANRRLLVKAGTGLGKSNFVKKILPQYTTKKIVIAAPTTGIVEQLAGSEFPGVKAGFWSDETNKAFLHQSQVVVTTYASLRKVIDELNLPGGEVILVIDESHHIVLGASKGFAFKTMNQVYEIGQEVHSCVMLSATPINILTREGFKKIEIKEESPKPFHLHTHEYEGNDIDALYHFCTEIATDEKIHFAMLNDKKKLYTMKRALVNRGIFKEYEIIIFETGAKETTEFKKLVHEGKINLPQGKGLVLCTQLLADGVSVLNELCEIGDMATIGMRNRELMIQFPARARKVKVDALHSYLKQREEASKQKNVPYDYRVLVDEQRADTLNRMTTRKKRNSIRNMRQKAEDFDAVFVGSSGNYEVSKPYLMYHEIQRRDLTATPGQIWGEMAEQYPKIELFQGATVPKGIADAIKKELDESKAHLKELQEETLDIIEREQGRLLRAALYDSNSVSMREELAEIGVVGPMGLTPEQKAEAGDTKAEYKEIFSMKAYRIPVKRVIRLLLIGATTQVAINLIREHDTREKFSAFCNRLYGLFLMYMAEIEDMTNNKFLSPIEREKANDYDKYNTIIRNIQNAYSGKHTWIPFSLIRQRVHEHIHPDSSDRKISARLNEMFIVEKSRSGEGKVLHVKLSRRRNLLHELEKAGIDGSEFLRCVRRDFSQNRPMQPADLDTVTPIYKTKPQPCTTQQALFTGHNQPKQTNRKQSRD